MKTEQLFISSEYCCGCSACKSACKSGAIEMKTDEYGFSFPCIDESLCVDCGLCKKVCAFQNESVLNEPKEVYAAKSKATDIKKSSSGGAFACIAEKFITDGSTVYGCAMVNGSSLSAKHIRAESDEELASMLGSKYVQSDIGESYLSVKADLEGGKRVFFSGTPCQVDGLYAFLQKDYENLYTADIICHGVPGAKMFNDYIKTLEGKSRVSSFVFRSKEVVGEMTSKITFENGKEKLIPCNSSSYFYLFINSHIYRESCYSCKYAGKGRVGDITMGDFWGIENEHPEFNAEGGVSCILINTEKGEKLFKENEGRFEYLKSDFERVAKHNGQLNSPSKKTEQKEDILNAYKNGGWAEVEKQYSKLAGSKKIISELKLIAKKIIK